MTRIVIADDEALPRVWLRRVLEGGGYEIIGEASNGQVAVDLARELHPDLVIMDIKMPEVDGIAAARMLTEERVAPVVLITAYTERELVEGARDAGVFAYVPKPFTELQLVSQIELAMARFAEFQGLIKEAGDAKNALETRKVVERAKGILMASRSMTEADAYRHIQRLSMNNRVTMREIAEAILLTHEKE